MFMRIHIPTGLRLGMRIQYTYIVYLMAITLDMARTRTHTHVHKYSSTFHLIHT